MQEKISRITAMRLPMLMLYAVLSCTRIYAIGGSGSEDAPLLFLGNQSLPPMIFKENAKPTGIVVDLAAALAKRMKHPVKFEYMNWSAAQQLVLDGKADALLQINPTEERKKLYDFSEPLLESEFSIFIRSDKKQVYAIGNLQGFNIGVEEKGMPIGILKQNPSIQLTVIPDVVQGMHWLAEGTIDAVVVDRWVGSFVLADNHLSGIRIAGEAVNKSSSAIAVKKGNAALLAEINNALALIRSDGTYAKIVSKWQPQEVIFQTKAQYFKQKNILIIILCMFVVALIWSFSLLREIKKRKKAEKSLLESEARTTAILDSITDRFFAFDKDWRYTRLNKWSAQQLTRLGKKPKEMIGRRLWDEFPSLPIEEVFHRAMDERVAIMHESYYPPTGEWLEDRVYPTLDGGLAVFQANITARKSVEETLRVNEERLRLAIDAARLATWDWDISSGTVIWNEHHYRVLGYEPGEIQPSYKAWAERIHPDDREATEARLHHAMEQGGDYACHFRILWPDGTMRYLSALGRFERDAKGTAVRNYGAMLDVTEHKRAESVLLDLTQRLTYHVDNSPLAVIEWGPDMRLVRWSGAAQDLFGWKAEEVLGKRMEDFRWIYEEDLPNVSEVSDELITGRDSHRFSANRNYCKDGSVVYCEWYNSSLLDESGRLRSILSLVLDVTKRKQAEEALRESRAELELRVQERTKELSKTVLELNERSEQLRRVTSELLAAEQHERQRLAQILHDGLQQILVGAKYHLVLLSRGRDVQQTAGQVVELLDDAIETSRSLSAELSPPILLQKDILSALEWLARWMRDKHGIEVSLTSHAKLARLNETTILLLFQSARELLLNVAKYAGVKNACVELNQLDGCLSMIVEDKGIGFDHTKLTIKGGHSSGTGLFGISERLSHIGGRIDIDSSPGHGSRFQLIVPTPEANTEAEQGALDKRAQVSIAISAQLDAEPAGAIKKIRIVLVDDHIVVRQGLAGLLRSESDFAIAGEASDGQSAIDLVRELRPDVVLMDISMPGIDGIQATRTIHKELPEICIIGLSMFQEREQEIAMREAGAVNYLTKSGKSEELIKAIRACVRNSRGKLADMST